MISGAPYRPTLAWKRLPFYCLIALVCFSCSTMRPNPRFHGKKKTPEKAQTVKPRSSEKVETTSRQARVGSASTCLQEAEKYLGVPYRYGGSSMSGMDCSGLVWRVWQDACGVSLPRISRDQFRLGHRVNANALIRGDLVFFQKPNGTVNHVGIYVGENRFMHASSSRGVCYSSLSESYWKRRWAGARRLPYSSSH